MNDVLLFLRAMVREDDVATAQYKAKVDAKPWEETADSLGAAFYLAARHRFKDANLPGIIRWVADTRAKLSDDSADEIDPRSAEWLIRSVVRDETELLNRLDARTAVELELILTAKFLADADLADDRLDAFLAEAETLAAQWATR